MTVDMQLDFMSQVVAGKADDQRMVIEPFISGFSNPALVDHNITVGARSVGIVRHGATQEAENNRIRQELLDACKRSFVVLRFADLPQSVKNALKVSTFGKDDMKLATVNGRAEQVTSGRPLTAHRIREVIKAVKEEIDRINAPRIQEEQEFASFSKPLVNLSRLYEATEHAGKVAEKAFQWGGGSEIAHYGFDSVRNKTVGVMTDDPIKKHVSVINEYNRLIGLESQTVGIFRCAESMWNIQHGACENRASADRQAITGRWAEFLRGHDVDIFSKIALAEEQAAEGKTTGWAGVIKENGAHAAVVELIHKNLSGDVVKQHGEALTDEFIDKLASILLALTDLNRSKKEVVEMSNWKKAVLAEIEKQFGLKEGNLDDAEELGVVVDVLDNICATAFFRQTSKLGLDFFRQENIPVVFEWTDHRGNRIPENGGIDVSDKWWKNPEVELDAHHGATITHSEMRHVEGKLNQKPGMGIVAKVEGATGGWRTAKNMGLEPAAYAGLTDEQLQARIAEGEPMLEATVEDIAPAAIDTFLHVQGTQQFMEEKDGVYELSPFGEKFLNIALEKTRAGYEALTVPRAKVAYLARYTQLVQANLLKTLSEKFHGMNPVLDAEFGN